MDRNLQSWATISALLPLPPGMKSLNSLRRTNDECATRGLATPQEASQHPTRGLATHHKRPRNKMTQHDKSVTKREPARHRATLHAGIDSEPKWTRGGGRVRKGQRQVRQVRPRHETSTVRQVRPRHVRLGRRERRSISCWCI